MFIQIEKNTDGSHAFQIGGNLEVGWAYVPNDMAIPDTFPYVNIEVELDNYNNYVVVSMTEGVENILEMTENDYRYQREIECFPIINRGILWYERLTTEQKEELNIWYQAWLDVTETKFIPEKPTWLK